MTLHICTPFLVNSFRCGIVLLAGCSAGLFLDAFAASAAASVLRFLLTIGLTIHHFPENPLQLRPDPDLVAAVHVVQLVAHELLHGVVRLHACTMAGVEHRVKLTKFQCRIDDHSNIGVRITVPLHHVESTDHYVRIPAVQFPIPVQNIEDSMVRASRKEHRFTPLFDHQALLVDEVILYHVFFRLLHEPLVGRRNGMFIANSRKER